jgi:dipeptidyl aminopeptidase/acylaminoacyl peptidase
MKRIDTTTRDRGLALVLGLALLSPLAARVQAQESASISYRMPPQILADMIDAAPTPLVATSPDNRWLLIMHRPDLPAIEEIAQPERRLAGLRINPRTSGPSRAQSLSGLSFQRLEDGRQIAVTGLPAGAKLSDVRWSPDGERIAFVVEAADGLDLWAAELKDGLARRITPAGARLNATLGQPYAWLADSRTFVARLVPFGRGPEPDAPLAPSGPNVQENLGRTTPARTLQDLLQNPHDELLFEHYMTSQVAEVQWDGGLRPLGEPAIVRNLVPSPDGEYLLVERIGRPFSYTLQFRSFPVRCEVWNRRGEPVHLVADLPLQDQVPLSFGSVGVGPRAVDWRHDRPAELCWVEALDGGDGGAPAEWRDRVVTLAAPFAGQPIELITLAQRYGGIMWGDDDLALVASWWWTTRNQKVWLIRPGDRAAAPRLVEDRSFQDRYADPGRPLMRANRFGRQVLLTADRGRTLFLSGDGASPEGDRPFLDAWNLATDERTRLFRSEAPYYERPVELIDVGRRRLLTRRESPTEPPNYFLRDLVRGRVAALTHFPDPTPQLAGVSKELIHYQRKDGMPLTATLYLPAGYDPARDGPLPVLMWAYPNEFKSRHDAGQVTDSPHRFTRVGWWSPVLFVVRGYAVLDDPTMPIVGEGDEEPNDTFVAQLVASAEAAVEELVRRGVGDPDRMAVGGHSYGAFMTANLLAHSDLFRAGLARSGAYNRTLTPFGFQAEERTLWQAPEVYSAMSPFMHADRIDEPILLVHGEADNNQGTFPLQSERLYGALKGLGGTARLVMLPHESHGYRARESILHLLWEQDRWLDQHVKNAAPRTADAGTPDAQP